MENVSRLPKEFWQHIMMLQTPVPMQSAKPESSTRYITYNFDAHSDGFEPQAPLPLVHRRSNSITQTEFGHGKESSLVAQVPRKINAALAAKKGGRCGNGAGIVSGRFEFVLDEADGTLWLINADNLVIEQQRVTGKEDSNSEEDDDNIRWFKEESFREFMEEQTQKYELMKQRWELKEPPDSTGWGHGDPQFVLVSRNAADRLDKKKSPEELLKYYQVEYKMLGYYHEISRETDGKEYARKLDKALGLCMWFKRWKKIHFGHHGNPNASITQDSRDPTTPQSRNGGGQRVRSAPHNRR
jgi:hypothetical protein